MSDLDAQPFPADNAQQQAILDALPDELKVEAKRIARILGAFGARKN